MVNSSSSAGSSGGCDEAWWVEEEDETQQPQYVVQGSLLIIPLDSPIWYRSVVPHLLVHHVRPDILSDAHLAVALSRKESTKCASIVKITICIFTAFFPILCMDECIQHTLFIGNLQKRLSALNKEHYSGNAVLSASGRSYTPVHPWFQFALRLTVHLSLVLKLLISGGSRFQHGCVDRTPCCSTA